MRQIPTRTVPTNLHTNLRQEKTASTKAMNLSQTESQTESKIASNPANQNEAGQEKVLVKSPIQPGAQPGAQQQTQTTQPPEQRTPHSQMTAQPEAQPKAQPMQTRKPIALRHQLPMAEIPSDTLIDIEDISKSVRVAPPPVLERTATQYAQVAYAPGADEYWTKAQLYYKTGLCLACDYLNIKTPPDEWDVWIAPITSVALALRHTQLLQHFPISASVANIDALTEGICADMQDTWYKLVSDLRTLYTRNGIADDMQQSLPRIPTNAATAIVLREIVTAVHTLSVSYSSWLWGNDFLISIGNVSQAVLRAAIRLNAYHSLAVASVKLESIPDHGFLATTYMEVVLWNELVGNSA